MNPKFSWKEIVFTTLIGGFLIGFGLWAGQKEINEVNRQKLEIKKAEQQLEEIVTAPKITKLNLSDFSEKEKTVIADAGLRNNLKGFLYPIFYAIRKAEDGRAGCEFGIIHRKAWNTDLKTQAGWAAATIQKNYDRYLKDQGGFPNTYDGFIAYLGARYCPVGADNDPDGLNKNWIGNVTHWVEKIRS
jgi:cell division protein FtsB